MQELEELIDGPTGGDDDVCHLADESDPTRSACGGGRRRPHPGGPFAYEPGMTHCPGCGRPVCPVCVHIFDLFNKTGGWEGV